LNLANTLDQLAQVRIRHGLRINRGHGGLERLAVEIRNDRIAGGQRLLT
jgi:hypothetical protein